MYIKRTKEQTSLLNIDENFITLVDLVKDSNSTMTANFLFSFKISKIEAINNNAFSVLVTVKKPSIVSNPNILIYNRNGQLDVSNAQQIVKNILNHKSRVLNINKQNADLIIASKVGDIFSKINNQIIGAAKTGRPISNLGLEKTKLVVKSKQNSQLSGDISQGLKYIQARSKEIENVEIQQPNLRLKLLKKDFISPSMISELDSKSISANQSFSGTSKLKNDNRRNPLLNLLIDSHIRNIVDDSLQQQYVTSIESFFDDIATIDIPISIQNFFEITNTNVTVSFELLKNSVSKGSTQTEVLEKVEKTVNLLNYYQKISILKNIDLGVSTNNTNISISLRKQRDDRSVFTKNLEKINIYKKDLNRLNSRFSLIGSREVSNLNDNFTLSFSNEKDNSIYRIQVDGQSEFKDIVTRNELVNTSRKVVIVPSISQNKISLSISDANHCLFDVSFLKILYKDVSLKEKNFRISQIIQSPSNSVINCDLTNLTPYHIYEITANLILENGVEVSSNYSCFIEFIPSVDQGDIVLNITTPSVTNDDVIFGLEVKLANDEIGILKNLLQQVSEKYDEQMLLDRRAKLDRFIAFNILRYNLVSGEVENLGISPNLSKFSDKEMSLKYSAKPIEPGLFYRYVIYPLIRDPYDVINEKEKTVDETTKLKYIINPRKHHHPLALIHGSSVSQEFINKNSKQDMLYGNLGISFSIDASIPTVNPTIEKFEIRLLDKKRLTLNWNISGNTDLIDHMLIIKEINGIKSIIGKSHAFSSNASYIHEISSDDLGRVRFLLDVIYNDYSSSENLVGSNYILINSL